MSRRRDRPRPWASLAFGALFVATSYADVLVLGRSLTPSLLAPFIDAAPAAADWVPSVQGRAPWHGHGDLVAAVVSYESVLRAQAVAIRAGDSPWWDPWTGCGTLGPESISFAQFSPISLATSLAGGGPFAFDLIALLALALAVGSVHAALRCELGASSLAAAAGAVAYGWNGFVTSYLGSMIVQPYLLVAPVLWALLRAQRAPSRGSLLTAGVAYAGLSTATFVPGQAVCLLAVHVIVTAAAPAGGVRRAILGQALAAGAGLALTAWFWLPVIDGLLLVDTLQHYRGRALDAAAWTHALSLWTPKHFWESHTGLVPSYASSYTGEFDVVTHLGILFGALACQAAPSRAVARGAALIAALSLVRMFGVPPFHWLMDIPGVRVIRWPFWGAGLGLAAAVLVASGVDRLRRGSPSRAGVALHAGGGLALVGLLAREVGWPIESPFRGYVELTVVLLLGSAVAVSSWPRRSVRLLVLAATLELLLHMNHRRPVRVDRLDPEPAYLRPLRAHVGDGRVASYGYFDVPGPQWGRALRLRMADTMTTSNLPWFRGMVNRALGIPPTLFWAAPSFDRPPPLDRAALDRLAVRALVVGRSVERVRARLEREGFPVVFADDRRVVFSNPTALDRVRSARALSRGGRPPAGAPDLAVTEDDALLEDARRLGIPEVVTGPPAPARLVVRAESNTRLELEVELPWPAVVVVADTWHPQRRAELDGAPVRLGRVDEALCGVALPAGRHALTLRYGPRLLLPGLLASALGLLAWTWIARLALLQVVPAPDVRGGPSR